MKLDITVDAITKDNLTLSFVLFDRQKETVSFAVTVDEEATIAENKKLLLAQAIDYLERHVAGRRQVYEQNRKQEAVATKLQSVVGKTLSVNLFAEETVEEEVTPE